MYAREGMGASIDDVIAAAEVSRGTFYNYFRTPEELISAVGDTLLKELIDFVEGASVPIDDPVLRIATGVRLFLHAARQHPLFATFIWRAGFTSTSALALLQVYFPRHVQSGIDAGVLKIADPAMGVHIIGGIGLAATYALSTQKVGEDYPEQITRQALLALGATARHADKAIASLLPPLQFPEGSLLGRT